MRATATMSEASRESSGAARRRSAGRAGCEECALALAGALRRLALTALMPAACFAGAEDPLVQLPVEDTRLIAPTEYAAASELAAQGGEPVALALRVAGPFAGSIQHVVQTNENVEAPTVCHVTVLRDGLLDDALRGERWQIELEKTPVGVWRIAKVTRAWRCWRAAAPARFATAPCP